MLRNLLLGAAGVLFAGTAIADDLSVTFADPAWNGNRIPAGQHCTKFGGRGATPAFTVEGIPAEADAIVVEYNDRSYHPLSYGGGHGKIGYDITPGVGKATLPSVPGEKADGLPAGTWVVRRNRATGDYARPGYLPPCSGGRGNTYFAEVIAVKKDGDDYDELASTKITLGRY
jgi:hypothetical protein